ncbi:hypothetical protein EMIT0P44_160086 [Pseudomonas sp. IT-P44]
MFGRAPSRASLAPTVLNAPIPCRSEACPRRRHNRHQRPQLMHKTHPSSAEHPRYDTFLRFTTAITTLARPLHTPSPELSKPFREQTHEHTTQTHAGHAAPVGHRGRAGDFR